MKDQFPQFDPGAEVNYEAVWEAALFVFDTNVLLNLYRYQASTRDQLLEVLGKLSERIWIPHHVALEFQRNRLMVIADQNKRFSDVQGVVDKARRELRVDLDKLQLERRHSSIDPAPLVEGFDRLATEFLASLDGIQRDQQKLTEPDPLKENIERLFSGRVGPEPKDQDEIVEIYETAKSRYDLEIPPGYLDANKERSGPAEYVNGGIKYQRKYGDFLIWHQILNYAKNQRTEALVFITDDAKDDWWWKMKSDGPKTLGPRPELRDEARRVGGINQFYMYNPEGFLTYSKEFLKTDVSKEAIQEVRDVSRFRTETSIQHRELINYARRAERAVFEWLSKRYDQVVENHRGYPDFIIDSEGRKLGFEVRSVRNPRMAPILVRRLMHQAHFESTEGDFDAITLILAFDSEQDAMELVSRHIERHFKSIPDNIRILFGLMIGDEPDATEFVVIHELSGEIGSPRQRSFGGSDFD